MNIILLPKDCTSSAAIQLSHWSHFFVLSVVAVSFLVSVFAAGYVLGNDEQASAVSELTQDNINQQRREMEVVRQDHEANLVAMTQRLGDMQARLMRLDALGHKLVKMAELDVGEFDFSQPPAVGGPNDIATKSKTISTADEVLNTIDVLAQSIDEREQQLGILDRVILNQNLNAAASPDGRPVTQGWISSYFGMRSDPFSGLPQMHGGIDFASPFGSDIVSVGAGIVTWSGSRYGYGKMVEINHGNGYVTRYAHASKVLAEVGQSVKRGEVIAAVGSSGRSTGPHVHFEVLKNGKKVNPVNFIQ